MKNVLNPGRPVALLSSLELKEGIARLSRGAYFKEASLDMTLGILTESTAQMSGIERVSIWALTSEHHELRCLELFELSSGKHRSGAALLAAQYPAYFLALRGEGVALSDDPFFHPSMAELAVDYLPQHKITARLDAPIHIRGELQGVFCLEQVGERSPWTTAYRLFAHAVANLVTLALVEYEANEARRQAKIASERMRAIFDGSRDALLLADSDSGVILDANRQAEKLFGWAHRDLVGMHQQALHPKNSAGVIDERCRQAATGELGAPWVADIQRYDGSVLPVEITSEIADVSNGQRLALGVFRPI